MRALTLLMCIVLLPAASAQFKWIDGDGQVGYGDQAPRNARQVQKLGGVPRDGADAGLLALPYDLRRAAEQFPVTLYTTEPCAICDRARELLDARSIPYQERTITSAQDLDALRQLTRSDQLPVAAIGRQLLVGFERGGWSEALDAADYPRQSTLPPGWHRTPPRPLAESAAPPAPPAAEPASDAGARP